MYTYGHATKRGRAAVYGRAFTDNQDTGLSTATQADQGRRQGELLGFSVQPGHHRGENPSVLDTHRSSDFLIADEWAAHINTYGGAGEVTHDFRESPDSTGYYEMYGTVNFQGPGKLSINVRGRFGPTWGTWSRIDLYCFEQ